MAEEPKGQRIRRTNLRKNREDIYCYDIAENHEQGSHSDQSQHHSDDEPANDDDSFVYDAIKNKGRKMQVKRGKARDKGLKPTPIRPKPKKQKPPKEEHGIDSAAVEYVSVSTAKQKSLKIFNPVEYQNNIHLKQEYEKQLENIHQQYGRKVNKLEEPAPPNSSWAFLLKQVQEAGRDFMSERQERTKLRKKLAKYSQSFFSRRELIKEQKIKQEEKQVKKQALELMRVVKRKFWGSALKVRKIILQQERKKEDKKNKMKKLEDLVARQYEASEKITKILEGYEEVSLQNIEVSQTTKVPVIINIDKKPHYKYAGLHEDNKIRPSWLIKFPLRQYQLLGVYWIYTLHNRGMNAILADEMGLGKTIQTIGLLAHLAIERGIWGPHLVIVPTTILMNWQIQFKRWCPAFKIMTYFGSPKERKIKRKGWSKLNSFHVCITSYKIAVTDNPIFRRKKWYYMVLDEAQNIKNFKSQRWQILLNFKTKHRLLLTGTPLQNDLTELWSLLHFLMPKIFNSFDDFNEWFNIPFQQAIQNNLKISQQILQKLHTILRPFFLRRLKKDVETQLPKKTESIVRCGMSRRQKYLYDEMIWHQNRRHKNHQSGGMMNVLMGLKKICNHPDLFQPRIEQTPLTWVPLTMVIAHHMFLKVHFETYKTHILKDFVEDIKVQFEEVAEDILSQYNKIIITADNERYYRNRYVDRLEFARLNYQRSRRKQFSPYSFDPTRLEFFEDQTPQIFSKTIAERAQQFEPIFDRFLFVVPKAMVAPASLTTFPMNSEVQAEKNRLQYLRKKTKKIIPPQIEQIRARFLLHFPNKSIILYDSGKLIKMLLLLKSIKYRGQKALVFTQMTKMLDIFEKVLNMFKFNYVRLDGNTKTQLRQTIVERFNNDPRILCFISSTRSGGIGLNLTGASNVIFYDTDWNPAMDKQAQDRCHRIGQTRDVTIYRLITEHSIEENILMKSIQKRKLQSLVTEDGMFDTSYFEKVSLRGLLKGAIDYEDDQEGDLAEVEDQEDRQLLHVAAKQVREGKDDEQEELQVEMLPRLFKYALGMLENNQIEAQQKQNSEEEQIQEKDSSEGQIMSQQEKNNQISDEDDISPERDRKKIEKVHEKKIELIKKPEENNENEIFQEEDENPVEKEQVQEEQSPEEIMAEQQIEVVREISMIDKIRAVAEYQNRYFLMKHLYEVEEQKVDEVVKEVPKARQEKRRRRRKR